METRPGQRVNIESVLRAQGEVAKVILAVVKETQDPAEANRIVEFGKQAHVGLGTLLQERREMGILQRVQGVFSRIGRSFVAGEPVSDCWE